MTAKLTVIEHPLVRHKISLLRDQQTKSIVFRALVREIAQLMTYEVTRDLALVDRDIETPVAPMTAQVLAHPAPVGVVKIAFLPQFDVSVSNHEFRKHQICKV